jgi:hypothetical protein
LTRANKVCHQPWQCFYLIRDKDMKEKQFLDTQNMDPEGQKKEDTREELDAKTKETKYGDNQFFGPWFSYKTTHVIMINGSPKDFVPQMVERIQFVRCWEITPIPKVLRK